MADPVLHLIAGPNGSGKSTLYAMVIEPVTRLEFVNADVLAAELWPDEQLAHAYEASTLAAQRRAELLAERSSFATETVFSHPSKIQLLADAEAAGYRTTLHIVAVPLELSVTRVSIRAALGGHDVPVEKVRKRYQRLWEHLAVAVEIADDTHLYDNSSIDTPFRRVGTWSGGVLDGTPRWPLWLPKAMRRAGR